MKKLTDKMRKEYVEDFGTACPFCGCEDILSIDTDYGSAEIWQTIQCDECGETWVDIYTLTGVEEYER